MIELTFSKSGREDIVLTEDDLFDFEFERGCFSGDTFELGGVSAKSIYMIIDNNTQRFPRGAFANSRVRLEIDGHFCGNYTAELPKRRNGVIELTAYDDMIKLDTEFPEDCEFPSLFWTVYAHCLLKAGLADHFSVVNGDIFVLNALFNVGVISHEYTDYIYANSCRNVVSGMAEWNGGFAYINDDGKLQVDVFSKEVSKTFYSSELMDLDYSDETVVFSKIKTSQKNKTYEMGDDSGYTLVINNQYIGYGLDDADFETYLGFISDYYKGFSLTPMSFTLAEPDFGLKIGDRISVIDEEENVTVTGNISKITVSGNCSMTVTCGGFGNISEVVNYNRSSTGQNNQIKAEVAQTSVGGTLTSYEYLSDSSVKLNGITYTVAKNTSGLITKITDSNGGELEPKISGDITEIALHNAALLGAVLARGIGQPNYFMPVMTDIRGYFDVTRGAGANAWINQVDGIPMPFRGGSAAVNNGEIVLHDGTHAVFDLPANNNGSFTVYAVLRTDYDSIKNQHDVLFGSVLGNYQNGWRCVNSAGYESGDAFRAFMIDVFAGGMMITSGGAPVSTYDKQHVVALRQTNTGGTSAQLEAFIDGVKSNGSLTVPAAYNSSWGLNCSANNSSIWYRSNLTIYAKFWALGNSAHSDSDIIRNQHFLMEKFL